MSFLCDYEITTLASAIYSITSWFPNRRFLGIIDKLNRDFINNESKILGATKIDSYSKFVVFYKKVIENYIPEYPKEEFPIDVGNVRFYANDRFHKVFIGNGNENTYETLFITESLVHDFEQFKEIWYEILEYEDLIISSLKPFKSEFTQEEFECPSEKYFNFISQNYKIFYDDKLAQYFKTFKSSNGELYPLFSPISSFPIFLPMMKDCFIERIESEIEESKFEDSVWLSFWRRLNCNFTKFFEQEGNSFYNLRLINKETKEKTDLENTLAFLNEDRLIVLESSKNKISEHFKKGMRLSQTMKDSMGDQKDYFFGKKAKGLKFKRRVEYFEKNLDVICNNINLDGKYTLKSYFLTNKIIKSSFVEFPFEIISFNEFKDNI